MTTPKFPAWKGNLLVFSLLIAIVLAYFFWQARQAQQTFLNHARQHAGMLAGVIELNARSAVLSQDIIEEIMQIFLGNTARFVDYLDTVEPFSSDELTAFALEAGLAGIRIIRSSGEITEGPLGWFRGDHAACEINSRHLHHLTADHLYFLALTRAENTGCIILGITETRIEKLHEQVSLSHVTDTLSNLSGIQYVRIETGVHTDKLSIPEVVLPEVILIDEPDRQVAETRMSFGKDVLVVGLDAAHFFFRIQQLWHEFFIFSIILALLGVFFSWLLYRYQAAYLNRVRDFERELARQREDAALGRAAASITHEIRNPLNAIGMGLQRLQMEADTLDDECQKLVATMLRAVQRTNTIVTDIREYAKPLTPRKQSVRLDSVVSHILSLYRQKCTEQDIEIKFEANCHESVTGDMHMLEEVVENLMKNSIEAQSKGGWIHIFTEPRNSEILLCFENSGFTLPSHEAERILEPYFTTKTRGTGLGLAIARRIIHAHNGRLEVNSPDEGLLRVLVYLPFK